MGNRALRKQAGVLLRQHGGFHSRLYRGKNGRKYFNAQDLHNIIDRLNAVLSGAVVHDCDANNHRVVGLSPYPLNKVRSNCGRFIRQVKGYRLRFPDQFVFEDGRYGCGCSLAVDKPVPREEIEKYWLSWPREELEGWKFLKDGAIEHLVSGGHLHDEDGILLPEWKKAE